MMSYQVERPRLRCESFLGPVVRRVTRTLRYDKITRSIRVGSIFADSLGFSRNF